MQFRKQVSVMPPGARIPTVEVNATHQLEWNRAALAAMTARYEEAKSQPDTRPEYLEFAQRQIAFYQRQIDDFQATLDRIARARAHNAIVRELSLLEEPAYGPSGAEVVPVVGAVLAA